MKRWPDNFFSSLFAAVTLVVGSNALAGDRAPLLPQSPSVSQAAKSEPSSDAGIANSRMTHSQIDSEPIHRIPHPEPSPGTSAITESHGMESTRVAGALAMVIALILLLRWGGRKLFVSPGAIGSTRAVQVLARSPLSPRQQIILLRIGRRVIVVGDSGSQMNSLSEITDADEVASLIGQLRDEKTESASKMFGKLFNRASNEMAAAAGDVDADDNPEYLDAISEPSDALTPSHPADPVVADAREEITGLAAKIRRLSRQIQG